VIYLSRHGYHYTLNKPINKEPCENYPFEDYHFESGIGAE